MEKKQSELCLEILRRFHINGILNDFILIGSWCVYFYKDYFYNIPYIDQTTLKTRDIDFMIDNPNRIKSAVDIPELLKDLGFVTTFKGKGTDKPHPLPKLGINAVALRFLSFLSSDTIKVKVEDFYLTLPHPVNFALHKLIISQRRVRKEKAIKDRDTAIKILKFLINKGEANAIRKVFDSVPKKWQKKIVKGLEEQAVKESGIEAEIPSLEEIKNWLRKE